MKEQTIESGAAGLLYQIEVIIVNSYRMFFNLFLGYPEGKKYPEAESTRLFQELVAFGCFVSLALSTNKMGAEISSKIVNFMITSLTSGSLHDSVERIFEQYRLKFGNVGDLRSLTPTVDEASVRIMKIHRSYRSQRKGIHRFLLAFAGRIGDLIKERLIGTINAPIVKAEETAQVERTSSEISYEAPEESRSRTTRRSADSVPEASRATRNTLADEGSKFRAVYDNAVNDALAEFRKMEGDFHKPASARLEIQALLYFAFDFAMASGTESAARTALRDAFVESRDWPEPVPQTIASRSLEYKQALSQGHDQAAKMLQLGNVFASHTKNDKDVLVCMWAADQFASTYSTVSQLVAERVSSPRGFNHV